MANDNKLKEEQPTATPQQQPTIEPSLADSLRRIASGTGHLTAEEQSLVDKASAADKAAAMGYTPKEIKEPELVTPQPYTGYSRMTAIMNENSRRAYGDDAESVARRERTDRARRAIAGVTDILSHAANIWGAAKGANSMKIGSASTVLDKNIAEERAARLKREESRDKAELAAARRDDDLTRYAQRDAEAENRRRNRQYWTDLNANERNVRTYAGKFATALDKRRNNAEAEDARVEKAEYTRLINAWNRTSATMPEEDIERLRVLYPKYNAGRPLPKNRPKAIYKPSKKSGGSGGDSGGGSGGGSRLVGRLK